MKRNIGILKKDKVYVYNTEKKPPYLVAFLIRETRVKRVICLMQSFIVFL